ncbi:MAG TPA: FUN14 domain-containing protein [Planctomycetota bacterium]|nr:FUN14 domain-containing protein [Planctomycetota bacterium]
MTSPPPNDRRRTFAAWLRAMPRWKQLLLASAVLCLAGGGVMWLLPGGGGGSSGTGPTEHGTGALPSTLLPGEHPPPGQPSAAQGEPAAQGVFRLGFSFLTGFCVGSFVRAMLKLVALVLGALLLLLLLLGYAGLIEVHWQAIDTLWQRFWSNVGAEWGDFQRFMTGSLPAAGLAALGLFAGLKKH